MDKKINLIDIARMIRDENYREIETEEIERMADNYREKYIPESLAREPMPNMWDDFNEVISEYLLAGFKAGFQYAIKWMSE